MFYTVANQAAVAAACELLLAYAPGISVTQAVWYDAATGVERQRTAVFSLFSVSKMNQPSCCVITTHYATRARSWAGLILKRHQRLLSDARSGTRATDLVCRSPDAAECGEDFLDNSTQPQPGLLLLCWAHCCSTTLAGNGGDQHDATMTKMPL